MTSIQTTSTLESKPERLKGSLAGTLVRTLLIFTFIPLALMAGAAYYRAQSLLREQAIRQTESLVVTQLNIINKEIDDKEAKLGELLASSDFNILTELALHANPMSNEFKEIRTSVLKEFNNINLEGSTPAFDQFFIMDTDGNIKVASNPKWEGTSLTDTSFIDQTSSDHGSVALYNLSPIYKNQFVLVTPLKYKTARGGSVLGILVGITETNSLNELVHPLQAFYPLANTYFILPSGEFISSNAQSGEFSLIGPLSSSQKNLIPYLDQMMEQNTGAPVPFEVNSSNGDPTITQLQWFPAMHAGVALELSKKAIYGNLNSLIPFSIGLVIILLVATGVVLFLGTNRVIKPLRSLAEITQKFSEGDWSKRAQVINDDEVGSLAQSFNHMADELSGTYRSLEDKVDERTRQIRTTAEVAQNITSTASLDDMLNKTVELLVKQFGFYQASVFMIDRSGKYIQFKTGYGEATKSLAEKKYGLEVGSASIIGWVSANNQSHIASDAIEDSLHLKNELLPQTRSEATIPIF